jgi:voltage-gated potassium channel
MDDTLQPAPAAPIDELGALVSWSAALFFWAEEGVNDGVQTYWDAVNYVATSLSVGYSNIFPVTPLGKTVGSVVQMIGPALSARALDPAQSLSPAAPAADNAEVVARLDAILDELRRLNANAAR